MVKHCLRKLRTTQILKSPEVQVRLVLAYINVEESENANSLASSATEKRVVNPPSQIFVATCATDKVNKLIRSNWIKTNVAARGGKRKGVR